ncbi:tRNA glutamyl-Q(34) synthetase GluQRS [Tundrisphaera lichenicola]|uniref:tRNA glutamyl-Q(34) synthetase GluQRS n=1 Tax=Tundrisphaera lichenicola TaxID=2029860 RepID=UPI003EB75A4A
MSFPDANRPTGRLAPSPTGGLHLGHARTFLIAWLSARSRGGRVILRQEDLDATRARSEAASSAIEDLRWLGIDWDEGPDVGGRHEPYVQSERKGAYAAEIRRMAAKDLIYPCTCTRADIDRASSAPHASDEGPTYPGTCSTRSFSDVGALENRPFAWRFRVPPGPVSWIDRFLGPVRIDPSTTGGDFVVGRDGIGPSYQLAVVHDDATMGVTEVIRGDDLVSSTPRQILLYRALGFEPPNFGHIPLAVDSNGRRLAKREGSLKITRLRESGVPADRLIGWLARACGWSDRIEPSPASAWISRFDLAAIPREPWVISAESIDEIRP